MLWIFNSVKTNNVKNNGTIQQQRVSITEGVEAITYEDKFNCQYDREVNPSSNLLQNIKNSNFITIYISINIYLSFY